jgi:hypothetical protein
MRFRGCDRDHTSQCARYGVTLVNLFDRGAARAIAFVGSATSPLRKNNERRLALAWHSVENLEAGRDDRPVRTALGKDGEGRMEGRGVVERAGVECVRIGLAQLAAEHQAHAVRAAIADRVAAIRRLRPEFARFAGEANRIRLEAHERHEARTRCPAAIGAIAMARADRLAKSLVAQRSA